MQISKSTFLAEKHLRIYRFVIIAFLGMVLVLFFDPYYERTPDSYVYGVSAKRIADEHYSYSNELLRDTGYPEFVPFQWVKTRLSEAVPNTPTGGMPLLSAGIFKIFGEYGLFYFGPIAAIALLMVAERVTRALFDRNIAFLTLVFLATSEMIMYVGRVLLTDNFFTVFFILGCFYLIKFHKEGKNKHVLYASVLFAFASFIRLNGVIAFPVEIVVLIWYGYRKKLYSIKSEQTHIKWYKDFGVISMKMAVPWAVFFVFLFSYNVYFFGDPLSSSFSDTEIAVDRGITESLSKIGAEERIYNVLRYSNGILPFPVNRISDISEDYDERIDTYYPQFGTLFKHITFSDIRASFGIITLSIIGLGLSVAMISKRCRDEIIIYSLMIFAFFFVFSHNYVVDRYMLPITPLFFTIIGYLAFSSYGKNSDVSWKHHILRTLKIVLVGFLVLFFCIAFYLSEPIQIFKIEGYDITNPEEKAERYPLDSEGLGKNSIVIGTLSSKILDYGLIPYDPAYNHPKKMNFDQNYISSNSIDRINQTMNMGYEFYVFKKPQFHLDKPFFRYLVENHPFVLKDYSASFCKLEIDKNHEQKSDQACI